MAAISVPRPLAGRLNRRGLVGLIVVAWLALFAIFKGKATLALASSDVTGLHTSLNHVNTSVGANRNSSPIFLYFFNEIQVGTSQLVTAFQSLISQPVAGRPLPLIGWLGVVAIVIFVSWV